MIAGASDAFHVIMTGRSMDKVKSAVSEVESYGIKGSVSSVQLDVTDEKSIREAVKLVEQQHGRLDALINNAAIGKVGPGTKDRMQSTMDTNVVGPAVVAEAFRPLLLKAEKPYSIYVSSGAGSLTKASTPDPSYKPLGNEEAYRASKAALNMLAVIEARDFGPKGLMVFTMSPGFVVSNLRGTDEAARTGWGGAGDPIVSGQTLMSILQGERDADVGKFVVKDGGIYPW